MDGQWKKGIRTHVHYVIDGIIVAQIFWERPGECVASICNSSLSCVVLNSEAEAKLWCEKNLPKNKGLKMQSIVSDIENIQGEAPAKEPKPYPTVGFENLRYIDADQVAEAIQQAFDEGYCRAMWLVDQKLQPIADRVSMLEAELEEMNKFLSGEPDNGH